MSMRVAIRRICTAAGGTGLSLFAAIAVAGAQPVAGDASSVADPQAHHEPSRDSNVRRSEAQYAIPNVKLIRDDGKSVDLAAELDDGRPVVLNFIYTSCTTTCPMSSQIFEQFQDELGSSREAVHLMSISIDPEQDTPARLRAYGGQFHAGKGWNHYSGTTASSIAVQRAFNAYRGDKMSHVPLTLVRAAPGKPWVRFDGFARSDELMAERKLWPAEPASAAALSLVVR
ncbi:MAG: SCO family protein [Pseudomonadota bacterium]|nr:SCO family protein [Pseudomonadota bacterium]